MIQELISTLASAGLTIRFYGFENSSEIGVNILAPDVEYPRGGAVAKTPERALALAAARGLSSIYHRVRDGVLLMEEVY